MDSERMFCEWFELKYGIKVQPASEEMERYWKVFKHDLMEELVSHDR